MKQTKKFTQEEIKEIRSRISISVENTGKFIRETRLQHHLSQTSLGSVLYVTKKAVSKWERGLCYPSMDVLPYLAETLGVTTDEIIYAKFDKEDKYEDNNKALKLIYRIFKNKHFKLIIKTILSIIFICLLWFFFENYNAVKIYSLNYTDENIHIEDSLLITTPINDYINIGYIYADYPDIDKNTQINYVLYIGDENKIERIIIQYNMKDFMPHIANSNYEEIPKNKIKDNINKLYLQMTYNNINGTETERVIKINPYLKYQSNDIIHIFKDKIYKIENDYKLKNLNETNKTEIDTELTIDLSFLYEMTESVIKNKYNGRTIKINNYDSIIKSDGYVINIIYNNIQVKITPQNNTIIIKENNDFSIISILDKKIYTTHMRSKEFQIIELIINLLKQL